MKKIFNLNFSGPQSISWDLTNRCNFNCLHCFNRSGDNRFYEFKDELSYEQAINCVNQIIEVHPETVCLCGGEPTLYPFLFDILEELSTNKIKVNMVSNGSKIDEDFVLKLKKCGIRLVQISLDSHIPELHNSFRQTPNAFEKAVNAIKILRKHNIPVAISMCPTKFNCRVFDEYIAFVRNLDVMILRIMPLLPMGRGDDNYSKIKPSTEDYFILKNAIFKVQKNNFDVEWGDPLDHFRKASEFKREFPIGIDIKSNGDIGISGYLPLIVGNIKKHSLREYWDSGLNKIWSYDIVQNLIKNVYILSDLSELSNLFEKFEKKEFDIIDDKS